MSYFSRHIFFCLNQREEGRQCCNNYGATDLLNYTKSRLKELGISSSEKIRVNRAGCLGRCEEGPVLVIYPEGVWYTYVDREDIDEIIDSHLVLGKQVERLLI